MKHRCLFAAVVTSIASLFLSGCGIEEVGERLWFEEPPYTNQQPEAYRLIQVDKSTSAEVLDMVKKYDKELTSQSESVVACWGEKKTTSQFWVTMVAFDEENFTVARKYFMAVDERPVHLHNEGQDLRFDSEVKMDEKTLSASYTSENERRISIIKKTLEIIRDDFVEVRQDSRVINQAAMMSNQMYERILYVLNESPALAQRLSEPNGLDYTSLVFNKSRVGLYIDDVNKVVVTKIRMGNVKRLWNIKYWRDKKGEVIW
ncbi:MAG: hypothetical protein A2Y12_17810 [Planctomycetes bacterium GWF2_42_9]|nr:MAG: hypothetical protein A2Y12_17810 [Planctomycetes bacterium GWF2_42_9]HAL45198.1 hypothetical protein [Phycisphaerales bacterium]